MANIKTERSKNKQDIETETALDYISHRPVITVDVEKYAHLLDDPDLTDQQKQEFLQTVWNIIVGFVDLGFGVHPIQQAQDNCGESMNNHGENTMPANNRLESRNTKLTDRFADTVNTIKGGAP